MLRWLKKVVASDEEKAEEACQVGTRKVTVAEPLMTWRDQYMTSKPEHPSSPG